MRNHDCVRRVSRLGVFAAMAALALSATEAPRAQTDPKQTTVQAPATGTGSGSGRSRSSSRSGRSSRSSLSSSNSGFDPNSPGSNRLNPRDLYSSGRRSRSDSNAEEQDGRSSRRSRRGDSDKKEQPQGQAAPGAPPRAVPQSQSEIAKQRRQAGAKTQKAPGGAASQSIQLPTYQFSPLITTPSVYFSPGQIEAHVNERFSSPIFIFNPEQRPVDHIDLWAHYPAGLLELVDVDLTAVNPGKDQKVSYESKPGGFVRITGRFDPPLTQIIQPVGVARWRAASRPGAGCVEFSAPAGESCDVFCEGARLIGASPVGNEGRVSLDFRVIDPMLDDEDQPLQALAFEDPPPIADMNGRAGVRLGLVPQTDRVWPGEVSTIDVAIINPDVIEFDEIRLRIRFDPEAVEILDADEGNYIANGVNIYDGGFHGLMPFDTHLRNQVNQVEGKIDYVVANNRGLYPYPTGSIARIVYRMKKEAGGATFWFEGLDPASGRMTSDVRALGASVLDRSSGRAVEALHNARVIVAGQL